MTGHDRDLRTLASIATHNSHATQKQAPTLLLPLIKQLSPLSYLSPVPWGVTDVLISKHFLKPAPCPMGLIFTFKSNFPSAFLISFSYINRVLGPDCILWAQGIPVPKTCSKSPKMFFCCEDPNRFWTVENIWHHNETWAYPYLHHWQPEEPRETNRICLEWHMTKRIQSLRFLPQPWHCQLQRGEWQATKTLWVCL